MGSKLGLRHGLWEVVGAAPPYKRPGSSKSVEAVVARCACGTVKTVLYGNLKYGKSKSCGCLQRSSPAVNRTHNMSRTKLYQVWGAMVQRCTNPKYPKWKDYGGRGITVCERWMKFENFYSDMGDRPEGMTLDRRDNALGYSAANCKWSTPKQQANNRRSTQVLTYNGVAKTIATWAEEYGILPHTLYNRVKLGWSVHDALTRPVRPWNR